MAGAMIGEVALGSVLAAGSKYPKGLNSRFDRESWLAMNARKGQSNTNSERMLAGMYCAG
jgi:hypothetical protein